MFMTLRYELYYPLSCSHKKILIDLEYSENNEKVLMSVTSEKLYDNVIEFNNKKILVDSI